MNNKNKNADQPANLSFKNSKNLKKSKNELSHSEDSSDSYLPSESESGGSEYWSSSAGDDSNNNVISSSEEYSDGRKYGVESSESTDSEYNG